MVSGIYQIKNKMNGHCYIGSSNNIRERWRKHIYDLDRDRHHSCHLQNAWKKYGSTCFEFSVIELCFIFELIFREQHYLDILKPEYNILPNARSRIGYKASPETRAKMSLAQMGNKKGLNRKHTPEELVKMSIANTGKKHSPKTRAKISASNKGRIAPNLGKKASLEARANMSAGQIGNTNKLGYKASEETRKKLSDFAKKRTYSPETRAKISASNKGKIITPEHRKKLSAAMTGKKLSIEAKAKISAAKMGKKLSPEHKAKLRDAWAKRLLKKTLGQ